MVATPTQSRILKFALFEVDLEAGELRKSGMRQKFAGQPFQVLQLLLEHPHEIVTREELQQRIWPKDTFVDYDLALRKAIARLREALGDSAESPRFIETIPRRGYRFIGSLHGANGDSVADMALVAALALATSRLRYRALTLTVLGILFAGGSVFGLDIGGLRSRLLLKLYPPTIHSLAVLPLQNLSDDPGQEYFSDGMTDALITDLAQIGSLKVISRTSVMHYKKTDKTLPQIARELNVDGIIEGTVQHSGDRVRITAQLVHGPSDKHLWANSYERDMRDVFALERDVTEDIARQIQARLTRPGQRPSAEPRLVDPNVLEAYLQGNYHLSRYGEGSGQEEQKKGAEYFQQAIGADPNFAPAYVGLASAHKELLLGSSVDVAIRKKSLERAVELDPNDSDARAWSGFLKWQPFLNWRGAEGEFRRAISLSPNNAYAHHLLGLLLVTLGRVNEGLRECQIAQQLDPTHNQRSVALYLARDYESSIATLRTTLQGEPNNGDLHCLLFQNYTKKEMHKEAVQELEQCISLFGEPKAAAHVGHAYAVAGHRGAIRQWAKELEHLQATNRAFLPGNLATAYTILGDKDRAFYWLEQAYEHREMVSIDGGVFFLSAEPMYDPLRSDPRFKDLLRRVGLPP
jgi:TolB-like protein/DNA-binding winged helix-turn-helix (wHTH) protein/tetratricopeptide (TPR) repeat protein